MKTADSMTRPTRIGLFGIGLDTYWGQFPGLHDRLVSYQDGIAGRMERPGVELVNAGLVDNPEKAREAADLFRSRNVDAIFLYISTYALSHTVLPVVQKVGVPVVVLNLQPVPALDYESFNKLGDRGAMTGEWLAHCQACCVPEIANVFNKAGIDYRLVTGWLKEPYAWEQIDGWIDAIALRALAPRHSGGRAWPLLRGHARRVHGPLPLWPRYSAATSTF
jgi:L-arabinose isomerase